MMLQSVGQKDSRPRILIVEDDREMCRFLSELLGEEGYAVEVAHDGQAALNLYGQAGFDVTITDLMMPRMKGIDLVRQLREIDPDAPVLVITAFGSVESAVEAMREGAFTYLTKPFRTDEVLLNTARALEQRRLQREVQSLRKEVQSRYRLDHIIGHGEKIRQVLEVVSSISDVSANVLVVGESGTGKELIARAIHYAGNRSRCPFIPVNCAAIPENLLESELFGYLRGAFTDAKKDRKGLFHEASGGTLFLDEISEIAPNLQAKLLRVIEDKEVRPLGANRGEKIDVRIITATNRPLDALVNEGKFRKDLFYRLNVVRIDLPPLRERREDIPELVEHFVRKFATETGRKKTGVTEEALSILVQYSWPGNIRELEHAVERAVLLGKNAKITPADLPLDVLSRSGSEASLAAALSDGCTLRDLEREYIKRVLESTGGNKTEAAAILGVDRTTLYRKLDELKNRD